MISYPNLTGKALFDWLIKNKQSLMDAKKAVVKYSDPFSFQPTFQKTEAVKGKYLYEDDEDNGLLKRTIVANTYLWLDSHMDVHLENTFTNSIAQRSSRPAPHLADHKFQVDAKVGEPIGYTEREVSWRELGHTKTGKTTALILETEILKEYNPFMYGQYLKGKIDQHSVAMRYIKMALAVNDEENYPNEYKVWKEIITKIGNRPEAEKSGFFWAVYEAALYETSAVLLGSNELTPTLGNKSEPSTDIQENVKPLKALDKSKILSEYLN